MRRILEGIPKMELPFAPASFSLEEPRISSWISNCEGLMYNVALIAPSAAFLAYLAFQARKSCTKFSQGRSYIMISYYGLLWFVSILNLLWCILQAWQCTPGRALTWNLLSLLTSSGMLFLEISLVAFLLQGNRVSGVVALTQTFVITGVLVGIDMLLKAIYIFGFNLPLFTTDSDTTSSISWSLWVVHRLFLTTGYGFIFFMHHSKWRERLPARPAFYNYIAAMFLLNAITLVACGLMRSGASFGYWLYNLTTICYHSLYLPFLYIIFLADFFQEEDLHLENAYYSEMKDAGFFDADWD